MKILLKKAIILDKTSSYFNQQKDILISEGKIEKIANDINEEGAKVIESKELFVSQSWVDLKADFNDPGFEENEDIQSGLKAAAFGGFGYIHTVSTTSPVVDGKGQVNYAKVEGSNQITDIFPIGAITKGAKGESLSEMYDMYKSGVRLFSDNTHYVNAGIMLRALLYVKNFGGRVISFPHNDSISLHGQVNEGIASLKTGLKAIPEVGEEIQVQRDLSLLEYTDGEIHFTGISTNSSVELIRKAKAKGLKVTCDVHAHQLLFNEEAVLGFDTNHKVYPPYRREEDRLALWKGIEDGTINCIVSNHRPFINDRKDIEFDHADFGVITLQTLYASMVEKDFKNHANFVHALAVEPRKIAEIESHPIEEGNLADITIFDPTIEWSLTDENNHSKSKNSPFYNQSLKGKAIGIIKTKQLHLN